MKTTKYIYPAQFINEDNGTVSVFFPDLEGCCTYDDTLEGAALMAKEALELYVEVILEKGEKLPTPSAVKDVAVENGVVMLVIGDVENMSKENVPVKKTLTIPKWLDREATNAHLNFSRVLRDALVEQLNLN